VQEFPVPSLFLFRVKIICDLREKETFHADEFARVGDLRSCDWKQEDESRVLP